MRSIVPLALILGGLAIPATAAAKPDIDREGGQWGVLVGTSMCIPGKAKCRAPDSDDVTGRTKASFGLGAELGYRWKYVFLGAAYNLGLMRPDYNGSSPPGYRGAYQNSVFGVVRPILPLWRLDIGLDLAPGFGRQTFRREGGDKDFSQGFTFKLGPVVDIFLSKRIFLGAKMDMIFNAHGQSCVTSGSTRICEKTRSTDRAGVHQMIVGLHLGGTFL